MSSPKQGSWLASGLAPAYEFAASFGAPGYYDKSFGHVLLDVYSSGGQFLTQVFGYGDFSGVTGPPTVSTTGAIEPGWVGTGDGFTVSIAYTHFPAARRTQPISILPVYFYLEWLGYRPQVAAECRIAGNVILSGSRWPYGDATKRNAAR